jgi:hypothetical protein
VLRHEYTSTAGFARALTTKTGDLAIFVHLVVFQHGKLHFLSLVFDFLRCRVVLLLALLATATKSEHQMEGGFFLDVVVAQRAPVFELLAGENQTLLVWWDSLLVLDFRFDIIDGVTRLNLKSDGLACECLDENLHVDLPICLPGIGGVSKRQNTRFFL